MNQFNEDKIFGSILVFAFMFCVSFFYIFFPIALFSFPVVWIFPGLESAVEFFLYEFLPLPGTILCVLISLYYTFKN